jgi:hypothetical protein
VSVASYPVFLSVANALVSVGRRHLRGVVVAAEPGWRFVLQAAAEVVARRG